MAVKRFRSRLCGPPVLLPQAAYLRVYLYELADAGQLSRADADALLAGDEQPLALLDAQQMAFVLACLAQL
jgi:hypothetical protein